LKKIAVAPLFLINQLKWNVAGFQVLLIDCLQFGQICCPSDVLDQPLLTASISSPSNQARPSLIRRPLRSFLREERRNSIDLSACGLQMSQKINFLMLIVAFSSKDTNLLENHGFSHHGSNFSLNIKIMY
jgi:hypothetical protein